MSDFLWMSVCEGGVVVYVRDEGDECCVGVRWYVGGEW